MNATPYRILVIDDHPAIHEDIKKILGGRLNAASPSDELARLVIDDFDTDPVEGRFAVDSAYRGEDGVDLLQSALREARPYAVAFVDVRMPVGIDGIETIRRLWELDGDLQVIICTAYADYSWHDLLKKFGHRDSLVILKKPFDVIEALQLTDALAEKWRLTLQARGRLTDLQGALQEQQQARTMAEGEFAAVLNERNRMAREVHDVLAQGFTAIFIHLEVVRHSLEGSPDSARKHLDRARDLARESLEQARRSIWNLRSPALETATLAEALQDIGVQLSDGAAMRVLFEANGQIRRLPMTIENNLLRIGQEAITNALKHSAASEVRVLLSYGPDILQLSVSDDGVGSCIDLAGATATGHFGLSGIQERTTAMRGNLEIRSARGAGTMIQATVPISS